MSTVEVRLWGTSVGAVTWVPEEGLGYFQYRPEFLASRIELSPVHLPLGEGVRSFPALRGTSFEGLPGLVADSLPDDFGHALIDAWLAREGRAPGSLDPVERLAYTGRRGMGALEYEPARELDAFGPGDPGAALDVARLTELADAVLRDRETFATRLEVDAEGDLLHARDGQALRDILRVGTSAGGARAKAVIAWNPETQEVRSGQVELAPGFAHWLLKFDGAGGGLDRGRVLADPQGFGVLEFAYARLARAAGLWMEPCQLLREGGRAHFLTRRFDRGPEGQKQHVQTLAGLLHLDYRQPGAHGYEQGLDAIDRLGLGVEVREQWVRRALFHVVARNQDDHVKNTAFLMDRRGRWSLAPAYDETFAWNPEGTWTRRHQMSIGGKLEGFTRADLLALGDRARLARGRAAELLGEVTEAVSTWPAVAAECGVDPDLAAHVQAALRLDLG